MKKGRIKSYCVYIPKKIMKVMFNVCIASSFLIRGVEKPCYAHLLLRLGFHNCIESCQPCPSWMGLFKQGKSPLFRKCCLHIIDC